MDTQVIEQKRIIGFWLLGVAAMVFIMVVLGGLTRLTGSGLSMVDWRPITGWLPPLGLDSWQAVFDLYKQSPQYRELNAGMSLPEFQNIFWLEYVHRLWGRVIGLAFALPFAYFWWRGWLSRQMIVPLLVLFVLGGAQGVLGWYMVQSGLVDVPEVSQYRLMAHLGFAVVLYGALVWFGLSFVRSGGQGQVPSLRRDSLAVWVISYLAILAGALVAGLDAGLTYNTFPLMDGDLVPMGLLAQDPWWHNLFENITTVQFQHRLLAMVTVGAVFWLLYKYREVRLVQLCTILVILQAGLGIATLIYVVPTALASLHQAGGLILFSALTWLNYEVRH